MKLSQIIKIFEKRIPKSLQENWDHSGLNLGSPTAEVKSVLFSYDVCKEVIKAAAKSKCQLIVSHHPFRMSATVHINLDDYEGQIIADCIKKNIALYSSHTNHDASADSLNFHYLKKLKLNDIQPLTQASLKLFKLAVFVPKTHTQKVMNALFSAGAGHIGNYSDCSFRTPGTGSFKGDETTNPTIGKKLQREEVSEEKLEVIITENILSSVIASMNKAHPYEEVAYDLYPLVNKMPSLGIGAMGTSPKALSKTYVIKALKRLFKCKNIRFTSSNTKSFKKIGICTGSGASFIDRAVQRDLDLFITGDVKYHQAIHAKRYDLTIADVGHFHTENDSIILLKNIFSELFGKKLKLHTYDKLKDAFEYL